ncbi:phospholipase D-like domain-containing protein [Pseudorhodobacter sp.]|uniref:phospholipase D family protein n=1 Tax=Pseudorhodobacter sp. TaxID=1934400 RepID=UPI002647951A|nr:phospholipase D-like domain-containing protein [Pseudorhodobacter sp.]MDN5787478.1 phospholipase D-like domain-containing protein [Pseudorhodobacter sp.]
MPAYAKLGPAFQVLLTADEAYPALEHAFLAAKTEIWASFRIFDLKTRLRSANAMVIGKTWFDLFIHTLRRGVNINIVIADFDPAASLDLHRGTWRSIRMCNAAAELASGPSSGKLTATPALHCAKIGSVPRVLVWPAIRSQIKKIAARLNQMPMAERTAMLREIPIALQNLRLAPDGTLRACAFPVPHLFPVTHHQKLAVIDRAVLYIGGLDLNERRFDTADHDRQSAQTWHDVQLMVRGPVVKEAQQHLETFRDVTNGKAAPEKPRRLLRTLSKPRAFAFMAFAPRPVAQDIAKAHEMLAKRASRLIYIETQYFRDRRLAHFFARMARETPDLGMILMLTAAPDDVAFDGNRGLDARFGEFLQARALRKLQKAFGARLFVGCPVQPKAAEPQSKGTRAQLYGAPIVYIHAKVSIFDRNAAIVSSANLNGRSLRWDTEAGLFISKRPEVEELRQRVMRHWLPDDAEPELLDDATAVASWSALARQNAKTAPEQRRGFVLPYDLKAPQDFGVEVPLIPEGAM